MLNAYLIKTQFPVNKPYNKNAPLVKGRLNYNFI